MSTTSNSRAERLGVATVLFLCACAIACTTASVAPEAPQKRVSALPTRPPVAGRPTDEHVEVASASGRSPRQAPELMKLFGERRAGPDDVLIVVTIQGSLGDLYRNAVPVIILNDEALVDTVVVDQRRLVAIVSRRQLRGEQNTIEFAWLGAEETTRSRRKYSLRSE